MNYLREINAFERQMRRQPLSTTAQLLWYKLMQFANGLYWPEQFQIDNSRLVDLLNVKSKNTLISARKELEEHGYLQFLPGVKGKSPNMGSAKKQYVKSWLELHGIIYDSDAVDTMIESAVYRLINQFRNLPQAGEEPTDTGGDTADQ